MPNVMHETCTTCVWEVGNPDVRSPLSSSTRTQTQPSSYRLAHSEAGTQYRFHCLCSQQLSTKS